MCMEYLSRYVKNLPILLSSVGQWWGTDSETRKEVQIDIVGTSVEGNEYLIDSCKYRNEKIGIDEMEMLHRYASVFRKWRVPLFHILEGRIYSASAGGRKNGRGYTADAGRSLSINLPAGKARGHSKRRAVSRYCLRHEISILCL